MLVSDRAPGSESRATQCWSQVPRADAPVLAAVAERLRPPRHVLPGAWAAENVTLTKLQAPDCPGAFDPGWLPFTSVLHDELARHPEKRGEVWIKPAQVGATRAMVNKIAAKADAGRGGRLLYITDTDPKAAKLADEELAPTMKGASGLAKSMKVALDEGRRALMRSIPFAGGCIDLVGAKSEGKLVGVAYRDIYVDEYELSMGQFPSSAGSLYVSATNRTAANPRTGSESFFGHPRIHGQGVHTLWENESDRRSWGFACPHCDAFVAPRWSMVRYRSIRDTDGRPDPGTAWLCCPHCGEEITDSQRARALWARGTREGAAGELKSDLPEAEALRRKYLGIWITRLCDHRVSVVSLAHKLASAEREEKATGKPAVMEFYNKTLGEPYKPMGHSVLTDEVFREVVRPGGGASLPDDIEFVTIGTDVQAPRENPWLYVAAVAWARSGMAWVVGLSRVQGWTTYQRLLGEFALRIGEGRDARELGILADAIDCAWETGQVLDNVRTPIYSAASMASVRRMAVRHESKMHADLPIRMAPDAKRINPGRPDLGLLEYYYTHRHTWVDRVMQRFAGSGMVGRRITVVCDEPKDFRAHVTANVLRPVVQMHGQEAARLEWMKPDEFRDDWAQAIAYAHVAACIAGDLDRIHQRGDGRAVSGGGPIVQGFAWGR